MMSPPPRMRAVLVDRAAPGGLAMRDVDTPNPNSHEALVRVAAIALDRAEIAEALNAAARRQGSARPGRDLAGTVEAAALDGSGPLPGSRVMGLVPSGAWAELVAVPTDALAVIPPTLSFALAAALPVSGLTALYALAHGGLLAGRGVLISGADGGAGMFAVQIAHASGARITAAVRVAAHDAIVEDCGADHVLAGGLGAAAEFGPYHLALSAADGPALAAMLHQVRPGGTCVLYGRTDGPGAKVDLRTLCAGRGVRLHGFALFAAPRRREPASEGLERLLSLIASRMLRPHVEVEAPWTGVASVARRMLNRRFVGKAVLHL